jgi:hypothetical protein
MAFSIRNEIKAMTHLHCLCGEYLSKYATTYEADCEAISSGQIAPFSNEIHARIQVRGEKEVLLFYQDFAATALQLLRVEDPQVFHDALETLRQTKHSMLYQYCRNSILRCVWEGKDNGWCCFELSFSLSHTLALLYFSSFSYSFSPGFARKTSNDCAAAVV